MAESAVNFLIEYMRPLLVDEAKLPKGVREEARKISDELESMKAFLRDADAREQRDEGIKTWVRQVRDAACDAEDILDEFILSIGQYNQRDDGGAVGFLSRTAHSIKQVKARHRIGGAIKNIRVRISEISRRKDDYNLHSTEQVSSLSSFSAGVYDPRFAAFFTQESQPVGIEQPKTQLISWLVNEEQRLSIMSVCGVGGVGKTTLVRKVYEDDLIKKRFETFAAVTVTQTFDKRKLLKDMIKGFYWAKQEEAPSGLEAMTDIQLSQVIREYLQNKRFLLIADDIWEVNALKLLSPALPAQECGSRVLLTMRSRDVAASCCIGPSGYVYELQPLNRDAAWSLFCRMAFPANEGNSCSPELEELARGFANKCQGLPLAIVTLGGLLASKDQTYAVWEMLHRSLGSQLENDDQLKGMMEILWLSFNDLPYYLKSCFSYLGIVPEDNRIGRRLIIQLWIAEGFIEKKEGRTPEEIGESYFNALISRNLIQVTDLEIGIEVLAFRIHDLLREIITSKGGEENLIVSSREEKTAFSDRVRRLSIYNEGEMASQIKGSTHLRSLFIFGENKSSVTSAHSSFPRFQLLRVINIHEVPTESFPNDLTKFLHLRFLRLYRTKIRYLPSSIGKLINLETMILEDTPVCELPVEIYRLPRLRLLSAAFKAVGAAFHQVNGPKAPSGVGRLRSLQELRLVEVESAAVRELGRLSELRILGIVKLKREDGHNLCTAVEKMSHLKSLEVTAKQEDGEIDMHSLSHPPQTLQNLFLCGHLRKLPHWIATLQNLLVLQLSWSGLKDDPLQALGSLPNLVRLALGFAYVGESLCVTEGQYPKLKVLRLDYLMGLKKVMVGNGAMPNLEALFIGWCMQLVEVPSWLGHLTSLRKLFLMNMPMAFLWSLRSADEAQRPVFIQHIPLVVHHHSPSATTQFF